MQGSQVVPRIWEQFPLAASREMEVEALQLPENEFCLNRESSDEDTKSQWDAALWHPKQWYSRALPDFWPIELWAHNCGLL